MTKKTPVYKLRDARGLPCGYFTGTSVVLPDEGERIADFSLNLAIDIELALWTRTGKPGLRWELLTPGDRESLREFIWANRPN